MSVFMRLATLPLFLAICAVLLLIFGGACFSALWDWIRKNDAAA